ncbi:N-acetylmuramoyl-L-alanine amidase family protein [Halanaerobium sp. Z-7514]|uniref:N-acetylmuramoyl-L-alanine amidase family protein n=1 Tax=Halanaerobium polyolivorans TaxID=2886943 RepID=A0AAW4WSF1_9FIRM|nr:N-acetylmuramoyl-L-alanine amidase [Halanaerobium polyolivorans]MCC3144027.1 N-acetylmuramoyl-L-alanine amidase family protein [Halanaerobium polyolivorans]
MSLRYKVVFIAIILFIISFLAFGSAAAQNSIYFNSEDITDQISSTVVEGEFLIKATDLAEILEIELNWQPALKLLEMESNGVEVKLMANSSFIQIRNNNRNDAIRTEAGLVLIDNQAYIPLAKTIEAFGYLLEFQREEDKLFIFQPETTINNIEWKEDGNQLNIEMDEISPYRVLQSDDGREIIVEIDKAEVNQEFSDNVSNNNFYLRVINVPDRALLRLVLRSRTPIPFQIDGGVYEQSGEESDTLALSFLPQLKRVFIDDNNVFSIEATGEFPQAEIDYLSDSNRVIIDIPSVVIGNYAKELRDNPLIKNVTVSQHSLDPVRLRIEAELKENQIIQAVDNSRDRQSSVLSFRKGEQSEITNLEYAAGKITFQSQSSINPDTFLLAEPPRLVLNLFNTSRGANVADKLEVDDPLINSIRSARFDNETVRIVADLHELTGYNWNEEMKNGIYNYTITFQNKFAGIQGSEDEDFQNLAVRLTGNPNYEVRKFTHPHRIVIDVDNTLNNISELELPEKGSLIKDIRSSNYVIEDREVTRLVFELDEYYNHQVNESDQGRVINIALAKHDDVLDDIRDMPQRLIVVDAGHGGFDPGAIGPTGLEEKEPALAISLKIAELLEAEGQRVILTRDRDVFLSLQQRVNIANNAGADLFVSIHSNATNNRQVGGVETYFNHRNSEYSRRFADKIHDKLSRGLGLVDRGLKNDNFYVIRYTEMPSALVEVGFLSNPEEEERLRTDEFRNKSAHLIVDGILDYIRENGGR